MGIQDTAASTSLSPTSRAGGRFGDRLLTVLTSGAALAAIVVLVLLVEQVANGSSLSISAFGLGFLWHSTWNPTLSAGAVHANVYGAAVLIYGTVVTSVIALVIAVPLAVAIAVYLAVLAHGRVGAVIGPLVELLAAVPSVILGLWGIIVLAPFLRSTIEPALHAVLGWIPIFGTPNPTGLGVFTAGVVLAIMVLPIIAAVCRDLFLTVPRDLKDGALALGMTRWEMIRGVVLDSSRAGIGAATILGLSRALGEAIAVTQVIGTGSTITASLFQNGDTLASRIAEQFIGTVSRLQTASLFYCALVLLVMELIANLAAQLITRRFQKRRGLAR
jgi:phosphate transport system permease protein